MIESGHLWLNIPSRTPTENALRTVGSHPYPWVTPCSEYCPVIFGLGVHFLTLQASTKIKPDGLPTSGAMIILGQITRILSQAPDASSRTYDSEFLSC